MSVLYYREDEFTKNGIPADVATWEDLATIGASLHSRTGQSLGVVATGDNGSIANQYLQFLLQRGGGFFNDKGELLLDSPEAVQTIEFMAKGLQSGFLLGVPDPYGAPNTAALKEGKLIAIAMPNWYDVYGLQLAAGTATVTIKAASGNGYLSVDGLSLVRTSGGTPQAGRFEAETAPAVCQDMIDSDRGGFSGSGYCNGDAAVGAYAQFTVNATAAGTATVGIRWANGAATARPANVVVNGVTVTSAQFASTGAWNTWSTTTATVPVTAGSNTIRIDPTTANGLPNIDYLEVSGV
ncbi:extracellular solute-binding protein [Dactylosporangium sp. NPDC050588]|uniref:extracellular solute-binding protein n=1 Tax=Dactylosporangium sp. NPDC050588 TaxID=3157211 RepID=UPI0033D169E8